MNQQYPFALLEKAVDEFAKLPASAERPPLRLVLYLLRQDTQAVESFGNALIRLKHEVKYCKVCHNISDTDVCQICSNPSRDASTICVVENIRDVMAIENTQQYRGLYHVLGGVISPMDGIGPSDLQIESPGGTREGRHRVGSHPGAQLDHGGRHNQFLHLPQTGTLQRETDHHRPRHLHRRRAGIYR